MAPLVVKFWLIPEDIFLYLVFLISINQHRGLGVKCCVQKKKLKSWTIPPMLMKLYEGQKRNFLIRFIRPNESQKNHFSIFRKTFWSFLLFVLRAFKLEMEMKYTRCESIIYPRQAFYGMSSVVHTELLVYNLELL